MGDSGSSVTQGGLQSVEYSSILDFKAMKEVYRGRHSIVWRCQCKRTKDPLVVKGYVKEKMRVRHFQQVSREVSLMQKCRVAGIVRFAGSFEDTKCIYIVQEDCSNGDLFQMLNDCGGVMTEKDVVLRVIAPLLRSLAQLHNLNVLHRDIKPENIFFSSTGQLKLGDFGLAICTMSERPKSRVGTLDYMAPEVISLPNHEEREAVEKKHGMHNVSYYGPKVDTWSVGILAYELLVGRPPFEVEGERETALRIMFDDNITFPPNLSLEAVSFIKTALNKSSTKRPGALELLGHVWIHKHGVQPPVLSAPHPQVDQQQNSATVVAYGSGSAGGALQRTGTLPVQRKPASPSSMDVDNHHHSAFDVPRPQSSNHLPPIRPTGAGVQASGHSGGRSGVNRLKSFFSQKLNTNRGQP